MRIFVIGHTSPDLDSIASAVVYAEYLKKTKRYGEMEIIPLRAGEPNLETKYVFEKFEVEIPLAIEDFEIKPTDAFVLVDHNEGRQRHDAIPEDQVVEINDHHKLNTSFAAPVRIDVKPFGSTSTLIYEHFLLNNIRPSKKAENLVLAAVLSDTQGLKSSTTTQIDKEIAHEIAENHELNLENLTFEIFKAKSNLSGLSAEEIVKKDFKVFEFGKLHVFIGQVETVEPEKVLEIKNDLVLALKAVKQEEKASHGFLVVTDVLQENSKVIYETSDEAKILENAFEAVGAKNLADIGKRMSRKKDIVPAIEKSLS